MERDSLIMMVVIIGLVVVSTFIIEGQSITGEAVRFGTKTYEIDAVKVKDQGKYSVDGLSFSLNYGESKIIFDGIKLFHESSLSSGVRFELSGACKNVYTIGATYGGSDPSWENLGSFEVKANGKTVGQFALKEGESVVLPDKSKITLLNVHKSYSGDNIGLNFELACI